MVASRPMLHASRGGTGLQQDEPASIPRRRTAPSPRVCVVIPCLNEELGIGAVVRDFKAVLPHSYILVVDNGSTDKTSQMAAAAGANDVIVERRRGKAQAILTALEQVDADVVIMVDGDGSYPAEGARLLLESYAQAPVDMVTGIRSPNDNGASLKQLHQAGQRAFEAALWLAFGFKSQDLFSGLRLFSRRFCQNVPILSRGFELELEFTIQAIDKGFSMTEIRTPFQQRAAGSFSKLRTIRDGARILRFMFVLLRDYRPAYFFGVISASFGAAGLLAGSMPIVDYVRTGLVARFPLAILAASLMVIAFFSLQTGIVLESSLRASREAFQLRMRRSGLERLAGARTADTNDG